MSDRMPVKDEAGTVRRVSVITSNEDHVGNLIAEGDISEADRFRELARLYKGQLEAEHREYMEYRRTVEMFLATRERGELV